MNNKLYILENNGIVIENYKNVETNKDYTLLIYKCFVSGIDCSFVIGSIENNITNLDIVYEHISKIISFRFYNKGNCFIYSAINSAYKYGVFDNINFSNFAYNVLINCKSYEDFQKQFIFNPKETILDPTSRRFSTNNNTIEPFNPLSYYLDSQKALNENQKQLKKVI